MAFTEKIIVTYKALPVSCLLLTGMTGFAQSSKYFINNYGDPVTKEFGTSGIQLPDGGYILIGFSLGDIFDAKAYMVKVDSVGEVIWEKMYGDSTRKTLFWAGLVTSQEKYIGVGSEYMFGDSTQRAYIGVMDPSGNMLAEQSVGDSTINWNAAAKIIPTFDGGFITGGWTLDTSGNYTLPNLIKLDSSLNVIWNKAVTGVDYASVGGLAQTPDSGVIFTDRFIPQFSNIGDVWLVKTDKSGNVEWDQKYDVDADDYGIDVQLTNDRGYVIAGLIYNIMYPQNKALIIKTDSIGNIEWQKEINAKDGSSNIESLIEVVHQLSDDSYIAVGQIDKDTGQVSYDDDVLLVKLNSMGSELWRRKYEVTPDTGACLVQHEDYAYDMNPTTDGGFIIAGKTIFCSGDSVSWIRNAFLIKTNCLGFTGPPVADFIYSIANDSVATFTNQSDSAGYFTWYFGDGDSLYATENDSFKSPVHSYADTGNYTVTLIAGACGEYDTLVYEVAVCTQPQAGFTYGTFNDSVQFTNTGGAANNYLWDFGDGSTGETASPVHVYADSGTYTVTLKAVTCGDTSTVSAQVMISYTGMEKLVIKEQEVRIYPNPATGGFSVELYNPSFITPHSIFRVYSMTGELIRRIPVNSCKTFIDTEYWGKGLYLFQLLSGGEVKAAEKIVVQ